MEIVPLDWSNLAAAAKLANAVFRSKDPSDAFAWSLFDPSFGTYFVGVHARRVVGTTGLYQVKRSRTVWLGWFCVEPSLRKRGFGQQLFEHSERAARQQATTLKLWTGPRDIQGHRLYERNGMRLRRVNGSLVYSKTLYIP